MNTSKWTWLVGVGALSVAILSGCGSTPSASSQTTTTSTTTSTTPATTKTTTTTPSTTTTSPQQKTSNYVIGGAPYQGAANLKKWEQKAKANPKNASVVMSAGVAAFQNNQPQLAINYYEQAAKLQPKNGEFWNNIGNVYRNTLHNDQKAISYYQKATMVDPKYDYGWYNWAYTLMQMNKVSAAKSVVAKAQAALPKSDTLYKAFGQLVTPTKTKP